MFKHAGLACALVPTLLLNISPLLAQEEEEQGIQTEIEVGITNTTGNTEDESYQVRSTVDWDRENWDYEFIVDAFRSSRQGVLAAQRLYTTAEANYDLSENQFILTRFSHDDDRFSGFDYQTDLSVNYGQSLLNSREDMNLEYNLGVGYRFSEEDSGREIEEGIIRVAGNYDWAISETANFEQTLSTEYGSENTIYRSRSSIETTILENLALRFAIDIRHQTEVPVDRENTDTRTSITFVYNF